MSGLGTPDLEAATRYCTDILGLQKIRTLGNAVYFRSDNRDHTLVYFEGDARDHATGFELRSFERNGRCQAGARACRHRSHLGHPRRNVKSASCRRS